MIKQWNSNRKENTQAVNAVIKNDVSMLEKIFKNIRVEQDAIERLILRVKSVEMIKLLLQHGGDIHKLGPPLYPHPRTLLYECSLRLKDRNDRKSVKLIEFLIEEGSDVLLKDELGLTAFWNCIIYGEMGLCILLVERGADPKVTLKSDKKTALRNAALIGHIAT
jgi:ankyrin repeat protein